MVLHVYCVTSGGIPVFLRSTGEHPPKFSELGPLDGVHIFGAVHNVKLEYAAGKDYFVLWKAYTEKLTLILINSSSVNRSGESVLNYIFDAMIMTVGIEDLMNIKNLDRLKKELKPCYPLIEDILKSADETVSTANLLDMNEVTLFPNAISFLEKLEECSENVNSLFCCLIYDGIILCATPDWWELANIEKKLLIALLNANRHCTTFDIPVFLPVKSPKVAFRFVACCLTNDVWISALCGPAPSLTDYEEIVAIHWSPVVDDLNSLNITELIKMPSKLLVHDCVLGILLINEKLGMFYSFDCAKDRRHSIILRQFYYQNVHDTLKNSNKISVAHNLNETYWSTDLYKFYAVVNDQYITNVVCKPVIPIPCIRKICQEISKMSLKMFGW